jgi:hypothetical protein
LLISEDYQGAHHVVLFVLKNMAVPYVFVAARPGTYDSDESGEVTTVIMKFDLPNLPTPAMRKAVSFQPISFASGGVGGAM